MKEMSLLVENPKQTEMPDTLATFSFFKTMLSHV